MNGGGRPERPEDDPETAYLERIAEALMSDADRRKAVLTRWGKQEYPLVFATSVHLGMYWLAFHGDDYLGSHGSHQRFLVTPTNVHRLYGCEGLLVVVRAGGAEDPPRWDDCLHIINSGHFSTWTERLL